MPFFLARGRRVLLIHGFRNQEGEVRHRRLHEFLTRTDLAAALAPPAWAELEKTVATKHPDIRIDWKRLREQAEQLTDQVPPPAARDTDARTLELRKLIASLRQHLSNLRPGFSEGDRMVFLGAAHDLRELFYTGSIQLHATLHPGDKSAVDLLHPFFFRDREGGLVDEAQALFEAGRRKQAEKAFARARAADPTDPDVLNSEGICWLEEGELARAEALFRQAADMARHHLPLKRRILEWGNLDVRPYLRARYNLGLTLEKLGRVDEAIAIWEDCLAIHPEDSLGASYSLAHALHRQGRLDEAITCYQRSLDVPNAHYSLAAALLAQGAVQDGLKQFLSAFLSNAYAPSLLLGETPLPHEDVSHWIDTQTLDWAEDYVEEARDLWPAPALALLGLLWRQPEVQEAIHELRSLQRGLKTEKDSARRHELSMASTLRERRLLPAREAQRLVERVAAAAPPVTAPRAPRRRS